MPAVPPLAQTSGFFALRTPLLPLSALSSLGADLAAPRALSDGGDLETALAEDRARIVARLRALVLDPTVREALFLASPSLDSATDAWLRDPADPRAGNVEGIVLRYIARMAARPTPFGLFAGCSVGSVGACTRLELAPRASYRRHTRLDVQYLAALCESLQRDPAIRKTLPFRPSSGLYAFSDTQLRYAEGRTDAKTRERSYELVSVERTHYLDATLARAENGAGPSDLVNALLAADPEIPREEADGYVDSLIDSQILVSDLEPLITGEEPLAELLRALGRHDAGRAAVAILESVAEDIGALDAAPLGLPSSRYRAVADRLTKLPAEAELARLFQVDLHKPVVRAEMGPGPMREIARAVTVLKGISAPRESDALRQFHEAFEQRYGERYVGTLEEAVPLALALDEETGIGFASPTTSSADPSPLLEGLVFPPDSSARQLPFGPREAHLARRLGESLRAGHTEWVLDERDLEALAAKPAAALPDAFAVMATVGGASADAVDRGEFRVFLQGVSGPSGALLLGRFCHGDEALRRAVEHHLRAEEALRPEAIFAEIVHLPEGRLGNILCRPLLREHEIALLGRSGAPADKQIPLSDLRVTIAGGRVVLFSARHAREVIPRMTTAHNYSGAGFGIYRFLCALQHARESGGLGWSWGSLEGAPFLPRVSTGRVVLSPARWNLVTDDLSPLGGATSADRYRAVQALRRKNALPRWVGLADGDNVLPVDLDNVLHVDSFVQLVKARDAASLIEMLPGEDELVAEGPEGRFVHEIVVPFIASKAPAGRSSTKERRATSPAPRVERRFGPGSEWLYAKLYTGTATADLVLQEVVRPVVDAARASGDASAWFFIRYADPHFHLRLRLRGDPAALASRVLPSLHAAAAPLERSGLLWRVTLDTYERETERYGGDDGIALAEAVFDADSDAALSILELLNPRERADARWRIALRGIHLLLVELGLDLEARTGVTRNARAGFGAEHRVDVAFEKELGAKFRRERGGLDALLAMPTDEDHPLAPAFALLDARSTKLAPVLADLRARAESGRLTVDRASLAGSFMHMHANRMLRADHRAQELVLYDFLVRLYESEAARTKGRRSPAPHAL